MVQDLQTQTWSSAIPNWLDTLAYLLAQDPATNQAVITTLFGLNVPPSQLTTDQGCLLQALLLNNWYGLSTAEAQLSAEWEVLATVSYGYALNSDQSSQLNDLTTQLTGVQSELFAVEESLDQLLAGGGLGNWLVGGSGSDTFYGYTPAAMIRSRVEVPENKS